MKLGVVLPRYVAHTSISAGAEQLGVQLAHRLAARGHTVEVITTCALDLREPRNISPPGVSFDGAVSVRCFELDLRHWDRIRSEVLTRRWNQERLHTVTDEDAWLEALPHAPRLYAYLDRYHKTYDAVLFLPYLTPTTLCGALLCADRSVLMPALHDEPFARMSVVRLVLEAARSVLFMTAEEQALALCTLGYRLPRTSVVGVGVDDAEATASGDCFRRQFDLHGPLVLYSGRLEPAKNVHALVAYIDRFRREYPYHAQATFVLRGSTAMYIAPRANMFVLPPQPPESYRDAYAAAQVLCQPSQYEAFSIVLMEGWLGGAAALVNANCAVMRTHVAACSGGLWFGDGAEFGAALDWLLAHPHECAAMGAAGRRYVLDWYTWEAVLPRVEAALAL